MINYLDGRERSKYGREKSQRRNRIFSNRAGRKDFLQGKGMGLLTLAGYHN